MNIQFSKVGDKFVGTAHLQGGLFNVHVDCDEVSRITLWCRTSGDGFAFVDQVMLKTHDDNYYNSGFECDVKVEVESKTMPSANITERDED